MSEKPLTDIEKAWLELEEVQQDFETLSDEDLLDCRNTIQKRIEKAMKHLSSHVRNDMSEFEAE